MAPPASQNTVDWKRQCVALVPCFNEAARIGPVVAQVQGYLPKVMVVDDGSTDATAEQARSAGAEIIRFAKNHGKGNALQAGWRRARALGFTWVIMLDGDGQHAADDIPKFFARAELTGCPLVVGNRMADCTAMPLLRRRVNRWMSRRISRMTGARLPDSQCGYRLAHLETLLSLPIHANRFEIESAMLAAFCRAGWSIEFVPIQTIYQREASKINPLTDTFRWLRWRLAPAGPAPARTLDSAPLSGRT
jgi:glycosyltransferase involved in cell wall biosynthesis